MVRQVAGVFSSQESVVEAVGFFHDAGYDASRLLVLAKERIPSRKLRSRASQPKLGKRAHLFEAILWGAFIGGVVFEVIGTLAAMLLVEEIPVRWFIIAWVWKYGVFIGGFIGTFVFEGRGSEVKPGEEYRERIASGAFILAVTAEEADIPAVRGVLIESGGDDVLDVESVHLVPEDAEELGASDASNTESRREP
jgi:hypothetical protein